MDLFGIKAKRERDVQIQAMAVVKAIQGMAEGGKKDVLLESLLTGKVVGGSIEGLNNDYMNYDAMVDEIYKKYNNDSSWGCVQLRAVVDMRSAFISGQGIAVTCDNEGTAKWIEKYLTKNRMYGIGFLNMVKSSDMAGQTIVYNDIEHDVLGRMYIKIKRFPYYNKYPNNYMPEVKGSDVDNIRLYRVKDISKDKEYLDNSKYVYVPLGGDDILSAGPTPKLGVALVDFENYDRALKDMRRLNHITARVTPVFQVKDASEVKALTEWISQQKWKIGKSYIGTAEFDYKTPGTGAHQNLKDEMVTTLKNISSVSGMPVHWLGYVDLMSNRATAESLYEFINNATLSERTVWEDKIYELILKAQEMYIDNGGTELKKLDPDFQVKIPLIDYSNFLQRVQALSTAYGDEAISLGDYRSELPGINPIRTKREIAKEKKEAEKELVKTRANPGLPNVDLDKDMDEENNKEGAANG